MPGAFDSRFFAIIIPDTIANLVCVLRTPVPA